MGGSWSGDVSYLWLQFSFAALKLSTCLLPFLEPDPGQRSAQWLVQDSRLNQWLGITSPAHPLTAHPFHIGLSPAHLLLVLPAPPHHGKDTGMRPPVICQTFCDNFLRSRQKHPLTEKAGLINLTAAWYFRGLTSKKEKSRQEINVGCA